jgi:hypothetical protein
MQFVLMSLCIMHQQAPLELLIQHFVFLCSSHPWIECMRKAFVGSVEAERAQKLNKGCAWIFPLCELWQTTITGNHALGSLSKAKAEDELSYEKRERNSMPDDGK